MRATTPLAVSSLTLLIAGCSGGVRIASVPPGCTVTNTIMVTYDPVPGGTIAPDNDCIYVPDGSTVMVTFSPTPALKKAQTKYKGLGNGWLNEKNTDPANLDTIVIGVPDDDDDEGDEDDDFELYEYDIRIKGVGNLDPRIVVE